MVIIQYCPGFIRIELIINALQGDTDQHSLSNEPRDVVSSVITTELGGNSSTSATTKSSIPTGNYMPMTPMSIFLYMCMYVRILKSASRK